MIVRIPGLLRSYTAGADTVELVDVRDRCATCCATLDARFPGCASASSTSRDPIRPHIKLFVDGELARHLAAPVAGVRASS